MTLWLRLDDPAEELPPPVVSPNKLVHHCQEDLGTSFPQISKVEASGEPRVSLVTPEDRWKRTFIGPFSSCRVSVVFKYSKAMDTGLPPVLSLLTLLGGPGGCSPPLLLLPLSRSRIGAQTPLASLQPVCRHHKSTSSSRRLHVHPANVKTWRHVSCLCFSSRQSPGRQ